MVNPYFVKAVSMAGVLFTASSPHWRNANQIRDGLGNPPAVSAADAPPGVEAAGVRWVKVAVPGLGVMLAAVARPTGAGTFPAVIVLHGSHGFAQEYVQLARELARGGLVAVAPCWSSGGGGPGSRFVTPIACADAPPMPNASSAEAMQTVDALVMAVGNLPGADPGRVGIFGHSRGGGAVLNYVLGTGHAKRPFSTRRATPLSSQTASLGSRYPSS